MSSRIELDANATTACDPRVIAAMLPYFAERAGNPSSPHRAGQEARAAVESAREEVAALVGAVASEVAFTASGTEAANLGVIGLARATRERDAQRHRVLVSAIEHPCVWESAQALAGEGFEVIVLPVDDQARLRMEALAAALGSDVALVAVMAANNETGTVQPIADIAALVASHGAPFFVDAVQIAGKLAFDFAASGATAIGLAAHKLHGPKGVGALVLRRGATLAPVLYGGFQEKRRRPGTENVPGIVGFGVAARIARSEPSGEPIRARRDRLEAALLAAMPEAFVTGRGAERVPNTISLTLPGLAAETLVIRLDLDGIAISTGAACSTGVVRPSRALLAAGLTPAQAAATIRLSLSRHNTEAEVDSVIERLPLAAGRVLAAVPSLR